MAHRAKKTEHAGPKKGRGGYYGRKRDAKHESAKRRRSDDRLAVRAITANGVADLEQLVLASVCLARDASRQVPDSPGHYAIFVENPEALSPVFAARIPRSGLIYMGIASGSLLSRLVHQDLRHHSPASFFRSLGAALGFRPSSGSLANYTRKNNYGFSVADTRRIIEWVDQHLSVSWLCETPSEPEEKRLIQLHRPVFNIKHNPEKCQHLVELRRLCVERASAPDPALGC
jgi:hypothetical protein